MMKFSSSIKSVGPGCMFFMYSTPARHAEALNVESTGELANFRIHPH